MLFRSLIYRHIFIYDWYSNYWRQGNFNMRQFTQSVDMPEHKRVRRSERQKELWWWKFLHHANVRDAAVSAFAISPRSVTGRPRRRQRNPKCEPGRADTRIHIAPPFCRTVTAYGVIKSPIYSSRARHQRRPRLIHKIAHGRALFHN